MALLNLYLTFEHQTEEAFHFYKSVLGGDFADINRFGDMPADENKPLPEEFKNRIMHIVYPVGGMMLMGSDTLPGFGSPEIKQGNNFSVSVAAESKDEADRIFNGLSDGGTIIMPLADTFWGAYFGMWTDKFGINWMINYDYQRE